MEQGALYSTYSRCICQLCKCSVCGVLALTLIVSYLRHFNHGNSFNNPILAVYRGFVIGRTDALNLRCNSRGLRSSQVIEEVRHWAILHLFTRQGMRISRPCSAVTRGIPVSRILRHSSRVIACVGGARGSVVAGGTMM
jgi:hypothetical protein